MACINALRYRGGKSSDALATSHSGVRYVSHDEGTELVIEHIEKYWCPSILSSDLVHTYLRAAAAE